MKTIFKYILIVPIIAFQLISCKEKNKEEIRPALSISSSYDAANYTTNAANELGLVTKLNDLTTEAKKGRNSANTVNKASLDALFTVGSPSLASKVTTYYKGQLEGSNGWFAELANASGNTYIPGTPTGQGGVYGSGSSAYLFDENGLEMEQLIEKGQFAATLYNSVIAELNSGTSLATVDRILALYGATPSFANSGSNNVSADIRDRAIANYAARRDKNDGNGYYSQMKNQLLKLQSALKASEEYNKERDEAIAEIKLIWEKITMATVINYCHSATTTLSLSSPTDDQKASALHAIAEGIGFTHGFRTIDQNHKKITDAQIDQVLANFNAPYNGTATTYLFATDAVNQLSKLTQVINTLKGIYGFTDQEINDFKSNWVSLQNR